MRNFRKPLLLAIAFLSGPALACRDAYQSHEQRLAASDVAVIARVSGILVPSLELPETRGRSDAATLSLFADRQIRLAIINQLKGQSSPEFTINVTQCAGSLDAKIGEKVFAYRIANQWRVVSPSNPASGP